MHPYRVVEGFYAVRGLYLPPCCAQEQQGICGKSAKRHEARRQPVVLSGDIGMPTAVAASEAVNAEALCL